MTRRSRKRRAFRPQRTVGIDYRSERPGAAADESANALGALYQGEKADAAGIFNVATALLGIGLAYLVAALGTADKFGSGALSWPVVLLLPLPLWLIAVFNSLMTLSAMSHGMSVAILEDALYSESRLHKELRLYVGSRAADQIMDIRKSNPVHKVATGFVYGGVAAAVLLFTLRVTAEAWSHVAGWMQFLAAAGYSLFVVLVVASWLAGFHELGKIEGVREKLEGRQALSSAQRHGP
jgi:hypothetical protein